MDTKDIKNLRKDILAVMKYMDTLVKKFPEVELPVPDNAFYLAQDLLKKEDFNLVVCGKVKSGKSSLINALIGKDLLPVCTEVATSRVFKISKALEDSFFVMYENGDSKQINQEELALYGSQATVNTVGGDTDGKQIAYIQVNTNVEFLPDGVSIIDTPGIGSTYPFHTEITKQYIKYADAVLYVLNPTPLEVIETNFINEIVKITPNVMFVCTKIDENNDTAVEESIMRNTKILDEKIKVKLYREVQILKMSSALLMQAAQDKELGDCYYDDSLFEQVKQEILHLVFLTQGYYRASIAYNEALNYYQRVDKVVNEHLEIARMNGQKHDELVAAYEKAYEEFMSKMGESRRKYITGEIEKIIQSVDFEFSQIFNSKGEIANKYSAEIDACTTENIAQYAETMSERLVEDLQNEWDNLCKLINVRISDILSQYEKDCQMACQMQTVIDTVVDDTEGLIHHSSKSDAFKQFRSNGLTASFAVGGVASVLNLASMASVSVTAVLAPIWGPLMGVASVGALLWAAFKSKDDVQASDLAKSKSNLKTTVSNIITQVKGQLTMVSIANEQYKSQYQGFIAVLRNSAQEAIVTTYEKHMKELKAMKATIDESKQNEKLLQALEYMAKTWEKNKAVLAKLYDTLESIDKK